MNQELTLKTGDLVTLKSGGPTMTIEEGTDGIGCLGITKRVACLWFAGSKLETGMFPIESLQPAKEAASE